MNCEKTILRTLLAMNSKNIYQKKLNFHPLKFKKYATIEIRT
jgi:hypothetical protein